MKTRVITAVVGIAVLVLVMLTFNTLLFNLIVAAVALIGMHEVYAALGFDKRTGCCTRSRCLTLCWSCCPAIRWRGRA